MRFRNLLIWGGSLVVVLALYLTDPDQGITTALLLLSLVTPLIAVGFAHIARKALFDYPEADMRRLFRCAGESPTGAGLALVALAIVIWALLGLFGRSAHAAGVPAQALPLLPVLHGEISAQWPDHPRPAYFGGLIEHESACPRASSCWQPTARLRTQREEGAGLAQITRAWSTDGKARFDALQELRERHPALRDLDWSNIYQRADLQLRALVLKSRDDWQALQVMQVAADDETRLAFNDLAYNAGRGRVTQDRRACQLTKGCDPRRWWGHVERTCTASRMPIYGNRSACDISRHHVADVLRERAPKYAGLL